jgi:hypothetical protein
VGCPEPGDRRSGRLFSFLSRNNIPVLGGRNTLQDACLEKQGQENWFNSIILVLLQKGPALAESTSKDGINWLRCCLLTFAFVSFDLNFHNQSLLPVTNFLSLKSMESVIPCPRMPCRHQIIITDRGIYISNFIYAWVLIRLILAIFFVSTPRRFLSVDTAAVIDQSDLST